MTLVTSVLGARGERPVYFECAPFEAQRIVACVPGADYAGVGVVCGWDAAPVVARMLDRDPPVPPTNAVVDIPGLDEYRRVIPPNVPRQYQREDALFLLRRRYALLSNPMRSGKSMTCLMAATLAGVKRGLVLCPSISKWVWADEIGKWLGKQALLLDGLNCDTARLYCLTCMQRGRLASGQRCPDCRARNGQSYGYTIYEVRSTEQPTKAVGGDSWRCRKHPDVMSAPWDTQPCTACRAELVDVLTTADYVICNYDLVTPRASRDARGRTHLRHNMRGWGDVLASLQFDLAILDECHYLRGFTTSYTKRGRTPRDRVKHVTDKIPIIWGVTGTPIYGFVRDLHGQLDVVSGGLFGTAIDFTRHYCGGFQGEHGWVANSRTNESELIERLGFIKVQRPRSVILREMPSKQRSVYYIESDRASIKRRKNGSPRGSIGKMIAAIAPTKRKYVVENVMRELAEGNKTYVLTYRRNSCEAMGKALERALRTREWRARMRAVNAEVWLAQTESGTSSKARFEAARAYREHQGAAVFVATIDSMPGSLSLLGATTVHMVDFHTSPSAMEQAEERPFEPGSTGLSIVHYVVKGSIDDDLEAIVIPKFEAKDKVLNDENAQHILATFRQPTEEETMEQVWARHCAHLVDDEDDE